MSKTERSATLVPAVGAQVERGVGRLQPERNQVGTRLLPVCWWCNREIHPLDDMHHIWCHGGALT